MKIAYLSAFFPYGGYETKFNEELLKTLKDKFPTEAFLFYRKYPVTLFPGKKHDSSKTEEIDGIDAITIMNTLDPVSSYKAANKIFSFKPDVLVSKFSNISFMPSIGDVVHLTHERGIPSICLINSNFPNDLINGENRLLKFYLDQFDSIIAASDFIREQLTKINYFGEIEVFPHPVFKEMADMHDKKMSRDKLGLPEDNLVILYPVLNSQKPDLNALSKIISKTGNDVHFLIAVETREAFDELMGFIQNNKLEDRVDIHQKSFFANEIADFFSASDIGILKYTENNDTILNSLCLNYELPVMITKDSIYSGVVSQYKTGIITQELSSKEISDIIKKIQKDNILQNIRKNITKARSGLSWQSLANRLEEVFKSMTKSN